MMMVVRLHCLCALISKSFYSVLSLSEPADSASWQINWKSWSLLTWWHKHAKHEWQEREMHKIFLKKHKLYFCRTEILYLLMSLYFRLIFSFPNILRVMSHEINEPPRQRRQWFSISCLQKQQIMIIIVHLARLIGNNHCFQQTLVIILINGGKTKNNRKMKKNAKQFKMKTSNVWWS